MKIRGNTVGTTMKPERTVVKCEKLTEEEKAIARANIGAASEEVIGLIDTALAEIITYQEDLIGTENTENNVSTITFYVGDDEFAAEEGMTFSQWVDSKYNTGHFYCNDMDMVFDDRGYTIHAHGWEGSPVYGDEVIEHGLKYFYFGT